MATDYQTAVVTLAGVPVPLQLFNGRPKRRTLVIAGATAGTTSVATSGGNFNGTIFARLAAGTTLVMPVKDYGPLVTGEIWVNNTIGGNPINGAEVFDIPTGV